MNKFKKLVRTVCSALCASFLMATVNADNNPQRVVKINNFYGLLEKRDNEVRSLLEGANEVSGNFRDGLAKDVFNGLVSDEVRDKGDHYFVLNENGNQFEVRNGFLQYDGNAPEVVPNIQGDECTICMEKLTDGEQLLLTPCGHYFHIDCLDTWRRSGRSQSATCPNCRRSIKGGVGYIVPFKDVTSPRLLEIKNVYEFLKSANGLSPDELSPSYVADKVFFNDPLVGNAVLREDQLSQETLELFNQKHLNLSDGFCNLCGNSFDPNKAGEMRVILGCGHEYHVACLKKKMQDREDHRENCPSSYCSETLKKPGYIVFKGKALEEFNEFMEFLRS